MRRSIHKYFILAVGFLSVGTFAVFPQSSDQNFPTPVTSSEINGAIRARDIGDGRLTRYFYSFDGGQGDIFINVVTKNFAGDIDVFAVDGLRALAKMVIYPDSGPTETGRLIYLRRGERLLLRIDGRSPNDDPATYRIKFGGSFIALAGAEKGDSAPTIKDAEEGNESGLRVNSVGTIIEVIPKPKPPKETPVEKIATTSFPEKVPVVPEPSLKKMTQASGERQKPIVVVTEPPEVNTVFGGTKEPLKKADPTAEKKVDTKTTPSNAKASKALPPAKAAKTTKVSKAVDPPAESKVDPLANIRLVVQLKTGEVIERPMSEVVRFAVDKGLLTVIGKDGKTVRYSILDVARVTIE